ncbi:hypothetical protein ACWCSD_34435 [Nonomuraea sp. NPDC001684]
MTTTERYPADAYTLVKTTDLARFTTLAEQVGQAATKLTSALPPAATGLKSVAQYAADIQVADTLPGITPEPEAETVPARRYTEAEIAAFRDQLHTNIHATGANGATAADLTAGHDTLNRVQAALRALETEGRIFRTGIGVLRWYTTANRSKVIDAMRRRVPNHDLTVEEAVQALGLPAARIRDMVSKKELGGRRVGKAYIVHRQAALNYIRALGAQPEPATPTAQ